MIQLSCQKQGHMHTMKNLKLTYDSQMEFKDWANKNGLNRDLYYFDYISAVDHTKSRQPDIPGVKCDGKLTWGEALTILKNYFKI